MWRALQRSRSCEPAIRIPASRAARAVGCHWVNGEAMFNSFLHAPYEASVEHLERCCRRLGLSQKGADK